MPSKIKQKRHCIHWKTTIDLIDNLLLKALCHYKYYCMMHCF